jgi:excisionase family DNA binding protein
VAAFQLWDGRVVLGPDGVRMVTAAVELALRAAGRNGGAARVTDDVAHLREVLRVAGLAGCAPVTAGVPWRLDLPASDVRVTVAQAAAIHRVSQAAIRKAIGAGRLPAERYGSRWLIRETDARQLQVRRQDGRRSGRPEHAGGRGPDR